MIITNPDREKTIYDLWWTRHTIDEIVHLTNIPRSTVGYYVRKFKKDLRRPGLKLYGDLNPLLTKPKSVENHAATLSIENELSVYHKISYIKQIMKIIKELQDSGRYDQIYYFLHSMQLFPKVLEHFKPFPREVNEEDKLFIATFIESYKVKSDKSDIFAYMLQSIFSSFTIPELQTEKHETAQLKRPKSYAEYVLGPRPQE